MKDINYINQISGFITLLIVLLYAFLLRIYELSFLMYILLILFSGRIIHLKAINSFLFIKRILILGLSEEEKELIKAIQQQRFNKNGYKKYPNYKIVLILDRNSNKREFEGIKINNNINLLKKFTKRLKINIVAMSSSKLEENLINSKLNIENVHVETIINLYEKIYKNLSIHFLVKRHYSDYSLLQYINPKNSFFKRIFDIILGILGCIVFLLILFPLWFINFFEGKGPLFYCQKRMGKDGKIFNMIKFRTMIVNAEESEKVWAKKNDSRITKVGGILRKARLDEIPQFLNVLKGDMSVIGPRPERPYFDKDLKKNIPFYELRYKIKPGITGWAQVKYKYGSSEEDARIKLEYDLYYIKNQSLLLDLDIIVKTVRTIFQFSGI